MLKKFYSVIENSQVASECCVETRWDRDLEECWTTERAAQHEADDLRLSLEDVWEFDKYEEESAPHSMSRHWNGERFRLPSDLFEVVEHQVEISSGRIVMDNVLLDPDNLKPDEERLLRMDIRNTMGKSSNVEEWINNRFRF